MTPAELVHAIRTAPTDDAALEVAEDFARHIVSVADAAQAAAVALAREELAAERAAFADLAARQFWRGVCAERAQRADVGAQQYDAVAAPVQIPRDLESAASIFLRALMDLCTASAEEADVHRAWAGEG